MMGMHGEAWVNHAIQEADLLIACGMRFDDRVTGTTSTYATKAKKIHIEVDPAEINKNIKVDVALIGDLREVLEELLPCIAGRDGSAWLKTIASSKGAVAVRDIKNLPDSGHLYAAHVIHDLWRITGGNAIVVTDVGQHQMWEAQYYHHEHPRTLITSGGLGTMGFALPAAIGAKFACPDKEVWVVAGDGGFQMTAAELSTIVQENIKINIAIINNGYLGMVRQWQEFFYERNYEATPLVSPDFVKLADAHGIQGLTVRTRAEVAEAVNTARSAPGTFLLNFKVEKEDSVYPMIPAGSALHEMIRRPGERPAGRIGGRQVTRQRSGVRDQRSGPQSGSVSKQEFDHVAFVPGFNGLAESDAIDCCDLSFNARVPARRDIRTYQPDQAFGGFFAEQHC